MAYFPTENVIGVKSFAQIDTATSQTFGTVVSGSDTASGKGAGQFIYLPGVSGTKVGSLVTYDPANKTTTLAPSTAGLGKPLAVAMAAVATTKNFGWYQIAGVAAVLKTATKVNPAVKIYLSATAGSVFSTSTTGKVIMNAITVNAATVASGTSTVNTLIQYPFADPLPSV